MRLKRFTAFFMAAILCFPALPPLSAVAAPSSQEDMIDESYIEEVLFNYEQYLDMTEGSPWLLDDSGYSYIMLADRFKDAGGLTHAAMWAAYKGMDELLTDEDCITYLTSIMQILDNGMEANLSAQAKYDSSKNLGDYATDAVTLAADAIGLDETTKDLKYLQDMIGLSKDTLEFLTGSKENLESFLIATQRYENHKAFLETVANYSGNANIQTAAGQMAELSLCQYAYILDTVADQTDSTGKWVLSTFQETVVSSTFEEWMKAGSKDSSKKFFKNADKKIAFAKKAASALKSFNLGAGIGTLAGDIFIGNEYRYLKEMMVLDNVTAALHKGIDRYDPKNQASEDSQYRTLKVRVPLLQSLCAVRTRGEYCANMLAQAHDTLFGVFVKGKKDKTAVYQRALALQEREYQLISEIFIVDDFPVSLLWHRSEQIFRRTNGELLSEIQYIFPEVSYRGDREAQKKIDKTLREGAMASIDPFLAEDSWTNPDTENYYDRSAYPNSYRMSHVLGTRMDRQVISILYRETSYWHAAIHPLSWYHEYNFDPETGEVLTLADILEDGDAYEKVGNYLRDNAPTGFHSSSTEPVSTQAWRSWSQSTVNDNSASWYFTPDGLCIAYSPYQIASYSAGFIEWEIPYSKLEGIVKETYLSPKKRSQKGREVEAEVSKSVDVTKARNIILYDGPGDGSCNMSFYSSEIVYDVCIYDVSNPEDLGFDYQCSPMVTLSSLSPATAVLISCGESSPDSPNMMVRWTDGFGNEREAYFGAGPGRELISNITK